MRTLLRKIFRRGYYRYLTLFNRLEAGDKITVQAAMDTREWLGGEFDRLREKTEKEFILIRDLVAGIHPVHVNMDEMVANAMLDKMRGPLTISQSASDWLKEITGGYSFQWATPLGYSPQGGTIWANITADGTLNMRLDNHENETIWRGE